MDQLTSFFVSLYLIISNNEMFTKEEAYNNISLLVERFHEQIASYKKSEYNETLARQDFINPYFKAPGWDEDNTYGNAEAYREVVSGNASAK